MAEQIIKPGVVTPPVLGANDHLKNFKHHQELLSHVREAAATPVLTLTRMVVDKYEPDMQQK